ncbi:MAG: amidinotransferase [Legionellales bacterium]|nr:amidinotransferase [Legionellales bacterium]
MNQQTLLMCHPNYYQVEYQINPWMRQLNIVKQAQALTQWQALQMAIEDCGGTIEYIEPQPKLPDMTFTANGGLVVGRQFFVSRFKYEQRQAEAAWFAQWFDQHGYQVIELDGGCFEGNGDAMIMGESIIGGYGWRTDPTVYTALAQNVNYAVVTCELVDPRFYHLDTCFLPISETQALCYLPALSEASVQRLTNHHITLIDIPLEEAQHFAANAIKINQHMIIPSNCPATQAILESLQFTVHCVDMTEFIYAGGACRCLTLPLVQG